MTTIDRTGASDAEFTAPTPPEVVVIGERVETVTAWLRKRFPLTRAEAVDEARDLLAALPPSPTEEAVKRVEALAEGWSGSACRHSSPTCRAENARLRGVEQRVEAVAAELQGEADLRSDDSLASVAERSGLLIAVTRLRAALASPAPALHGEEGQR